MNILKSIKGPFHIWVLKKKKIEFSPQTLLFSAGEIFFLPISCFSYDNNVFTVEFISEIRVVTFSIFHDWTLFIRIHLYFRFKKYTLFPRLRELCVCDLAFSLYFISVFNRETGRERKSANQIPRAPTLQNGIFRSK